MKKSEIINIIKEELEMLTEVKVKKGDVIYDKSYDEYGVVNRVKGRVAYIKFQSTGAKSFDPVLVSDIKYKGKHKGKDLYVTEAICADQSYRYEKEESVAPDHDGKAAPYGSGYDKIKEDKDVGHQDDEPNMLKSTALEIMEYGKKLMDKLDKYDDMEEEVDFPNWWQSKLIISKEYLQKAYHYLDSEEKTEESINEALARGLKPLLKLGSKVGWNTMSEDALLDLSDKFEKIDDEDADSIASHLNMSIELRQDGNRGAATKKMKQFNKACKDALKGKPIKSAFEGVVTEAFKKGDKVKYLGHPGIITNVSDYNGKTYYSVAYNKGTGKTKAKGILSTDGSITEATSLWKAFDAKMKLQDEIMDLEMDMKMITKDLSQLHKDMEQEAEPEGGKVATRYGRDIEKKEKEYKKKKAEFKKLMKKLDKMEQY